MNKRDLESLQNQLSYNLRVIKALWKSKWGHFGESGIKGHEYDFNSLYRSMEKGKETIRLYIKCEYRYKEASMRNWATRIEAKTGIPCEYLTGEERIVLGTEYEKKAYCLYEQYICQRDSVGEQLEEAENYLSSDEASENKDKTLEYVSAEDIKQLVKTDLSKEEQKEFYDSIKEADKTVLLFKLFNSYLEKEVKRIISLDTAILMQQNAKLCKLSYFIKFRKKYDGINIRTIDEMKMMMKETRTSQLLGLGEDGLKKYIKVLEEHLNLAKSVYTVAIDCGNFTPSKAQKK